ncbi:unnamed protein product, partial [Eretmochelys imbricata]
MFDDRIYPVCTFGATGYIDKWLIGEDHIYRYPANKELARNYTKLCSVLILS